MISLVNLIRENLESLVISITSEQGKTLADARGDMLRGFQGCEIACGISTQMTGEVLEVAKDMENHSYESYRELSDVIAVICPFNFLAKMPLYLVESSASGGDRELLLAEALRACLRGGDDY